MICLPSVIALPLSRSERLTVLWRIYWHVWCQKLFRITKILISQLAGKFGRTLQRDRRVARIRAELRAKLKSLFALQGPHPTPFGNAAFLIR